MDEKRMKQRVKDYKILGKGILKGYKLTFNKSASKGNGQGYANIFQDEKETVEGIIYEINESAIKELDSYEGVTTSHYYKTEMPINTIKGTLKCVVYIAHQQKTKTGLKPTKDYLRHLLKGKQFLSKNYYEWLLKMETVD